MTNPRRTLARQCLTAVVVVLGAFVASHQLVGFDLRLVWISWVELVFVGSSLASSVPVLLLGLLAFFVPKAVWALLIEPLAFFDLVLRAAVVLPLGKLVFFVQ